MKVNVAGAGAGKTRMMADLITKCDIPDGKVIYCIAFTNAAANIIAEKVEKKLGRIPNNIMVSTIHSFLYHELISPYYFFLYGKQFERLSVIDLPVNENFKRVKLSELEAENTLHYTKIPEKAKWVAYKKSGDKKATTDLRKKILSRFKNYCAAIYVDEAQDISEDVRLILESLDNEGVDIVLFGDPKQDVKGLGQFRQIIEANSGVNYISICHRCPQKHLDISNTLASVFEQQVADQDNAEGNIEVIFESDINNIQDFIESGTFGLKYISMKRERFATHEKQEKCNRFESLYYEVHRAVTKKWKGILSEIEIKRVSFYVAERMLNDFNGYNSDRIISEWCKNKAFDYLTKKQYASIVSILRVEDEAKTDIPVVSSIEIIKGREAERCLFILSPDLAPYLFKEKIEDNKSNHLLYVALTRSLDHLTILVMKEVEIKYTREKIMKCFHM